MNKANITPSDRTLVTSLMKPVFCKLNPPFSPRDIKRQYPRYLEIKLDGFNLVKIEPIIIPERKNKSAGFKIALIINKK